MLELHYKKSSLKPIIQRLTSTYISGFGQRCVIPNQHQKFRQDMRKLIAHKEKLVELKDRIHHTEGRDRGNGKFSHKSKKLLLMHYAHDFYFVFTLKFLYHFSFKLIDFQFQLPFKYF